VPRAGYLLVAEVADAAKLARFVGAASGVPRSCVVDVANAIIALHERGFLHGDLTINNVLLDAAGKPWFSDLERARQTGGPLSWRRAVDDFHRFARHFVKFSPAGRRSALRLLKAYCAGRGWSGREREFIAAMAKRLRGKEATALPTI
jgi:tRNA A-37 threonylcarbamoyl transferase component Bud32